MLLNLPAVASALLLLASGSSTLAARVGEGQSCSTANNRIDINSGAFLTDCDAQTYCTSAGTCAARGCRSDEYPYGYNGVAFADLPPMCPRGQFCPDEEDQCLPQQAVGQPCQLDRDDECAPPPNGRELAGFLNVNGSVCLNFVCYYANVTLGQACVNENRAYTAFTNEGGYAVVVSRDNCANGLYCDGPTLQCNKMHTVGSSCGANKECLSYNCENGVCGQLNDAPRRPATWVYVVVVVLIVLIIVGVGVGLWFLHKRTRDQNRVKLEQYYHEQVAYRESLKSLYHARNSLLAQRDSSGDSTRRSLLANDALARGYDPNANPFARNEYKDDYSDDGTAEQYSDGLNHEKR